MFYVLFYDIMSLAWKKLQRPVETLCVIMREDFTNAAQNKAPLWSLICAEHQICVASVTAGTTLERHIENLFSFSFSLKISEPFRITE